MTMVFRVSGMTHVLMKAHSHTLLTRLQRDGSQSVDLADRKAPQMLSEHVGASAERIKRTFVIEVRSELLHTEVTASPRSGHRKHTVARYQCKSCRTK